MSIYELILMVLITFSYSLMNELFGKIWNNNVIMHGVLFHLEQGLPG